MAKIPWRSPFEWEGTVQEAVNEREEKRDYLGAKRSKETFRDIV